MSSLFDKVSMEEFGLVDTSVTDIALEEMNADLGIALAGLMPATALLQNTAIVEAALESHEGELATSTKELIDLNENTFEVIVNDLEVLADVGLEEEKSEKGLFGRILATIIAFLRKVLTWVLLFISGVFAAIGLVPNTLAVIFATAALKTATPAMKGADPKEKTDTVSTEAGDSPEITMKPKQRAYVYGTATDLAKLNKAYKAEGISANVPDIGKSVDKLVRTSMSNLDAVKKMAIGKLNKSGFVNFDKPLSKYEESLKAQTAFIKAETKKGIAMAEAMAKSKEKSPGTIKKLKERNKAIKYLVSVTKIQGMIFKTLATEKSWTAG